MFKILLDSATCSIKCFTAVRWGGGGGASKGSTDVRRVRKLSQAKFRKKTQCPGKKVPKNLMTGEVFMTLEGQN